MRRTLGLFARSIACAVVLAGPAHLRADDAWWSFRPLRRPAVPASDSSWVRATVDAFILAKLSEAELTPSPPADRRTLIRQLTFDLHGLPPTPEEIAAFLDDRAPDAYERLVDRLLASPRYGEAWGRHWLDLARYADTAGDSSDYPIPDAWRYRNWVIDAFNADLPYDQFLRDQIAGDVLAAEAPEKGFAQRTVATGFLALARRFGVGKDAERHLTIEDMIELTKLGFGVIASGGISTLDDVRRLADVSRKHPRLTGAIIGFAAAGAFFVLLTLPKRRRETGSTIGWSRRLH